MKSSAWIGALFSYETELIEAANLRAKQGPPAFDFANFPSYRLIEMCERPGFQSFPVFVKVVIAAILVF